MKARLNHITVEGFNGVVTKVMATHKLTRVYNAEHWNEWHDAYYFMFDVISNTTGEVFNTITIIQ